MELSKNEFVKDALAWIKVLKQGKNVSVNVSLEFSQWIWRQGEYLVRREEEYEVHIAWSDVHHCPLLLLRYCENVSKIPKLPIGFVGSFDYHPVLVDEVFYMIHACETDSWMNLLLTTSSALPAGVFLLSWWSFMANQVLELKLDPDVFKNAKYALEDSR